MELSTDMPPKMEFEIPQGRLVYYLAPCIGVRASRRGCIPRRLAVGSTTLVFPYSWLPTISVFSGRRLGVSVIVGYLR